MWVVGTLAQQVIVASLTLFFAPSALPIFYRDGRASRKGACVWPTAARAWARSRGGGGGGMQIVRERAREARDSSYCIIFSAAAVRPKGKETLDEPHRAASESLRRPGRAEGRRDDGDRGTR